jgi:hypothetical protein
MKNLRWKSRYLTGTPEVDQQNRALVECLNGFIQAAKQREHCQEIEGLLEESVVRLEHFLSEKPIAADLTSRMKTSLINSLPMPTWGTPACRKCDICDLAEQRIAQHIKSSVECLGITMGQKDFR